MMAQRGWAAQAVAALPRAMDLLQQAAKSIPSSSTSPYIDSPLASLAIAVALTAVTGLVVAAALGGIIDFTLSQRKRKGSPLTLKQWCAAFDCESGRLINHHKVLEKIRLGGIVPSIRAAVWPFLLGFYELDSTQEERESERRRKRELYIALKVQCNSLRHSGPEVAAEYENSNESTKVSSNGSLEELKGAAILECENVSESGEAIFDGLSSSSEEQKTAAIFECKNEKEIGETISTGQSFSSEEQNDASLLKCENENGSGEVIYDGWSSPSEELEDAATASNHLSFSNSGTEETVEGPEEPPEVEGKPPLVGEDKVTLPSDNPSSPSKTNEENGKDEELPQTKNESAIAKSELDCLEATDDFINCQRIIRVDAVRMNAEWVPYSPSQANVTKELAFELARNVDLKDDEHLEPCRQHHAARLVAILEAYALYDPETGYCQGMSDLLSPFVALLDEDYEAFWCFVEFMSTARYNFRSDETGIRRQLNKTSRIFKATDAHLYSHLERTDAENCFFVYRMVVVLLRRELSFEQTISLWEILWAENKALSISHARSAGERVTRKTFLTEDLILFVIAAAVRQRRKVIIEKCSALDELLRECNSMAGHLDVWKLLTDAREMSYAARRHLADQ